MYMHPHTDDPARPRARGVRRGVALALAFVFLAPMATLALASGGDGPRSAIPQTALDRLLVGTRPAGTASTVKPAAVQVTIPRTPAGAQLAWLLAEVNGGSATLTASEVRAHVSRSFLAALPADRIVELLNRSTTAYGPFRLTAIARRSSVASATASVTARSHRGLVIRVRVDARADITSIDISDAPRTRTA
jgi:hypothetical protein